MAMLPTINERAWAIDLISEICRLVKEGRRSIQSAGGEQTLAGSAGGHAVFPDVLLFGDPSQSAVLQGWELKMPDTPITDEVLLNNAQDKCRRLGVSSFVVWNVTDAVLYRVTDGQREIVKTWHCQEIRSRHDVQSKKQAWLQLLVEILEDINDYFEQGVISRTKPLPAQLNDVVAAILLESSGKLAETLKAAEQRSRQWRAEVSVWWRGVRAEHGHSTDAMRLTILASEILLHWVHRFLFAHYLKRFVAEAWSVDTLNGDATVSDAESFFAELSGKHDFVQVFRSRLGADLLPSPIWREIIAFNGFLRDARLSEINQGLLQETLQAVRQESQRKVAGQFGTPPALALLLAYLSMDDLAAPVLDPCCGTGTIARAVFDLKIRHGINRSTVVDTVWASDRYAMPLQFATLSLTAGAAPFETLKVFQHDVMALRSGQNVAFTDAGSGAILNQTVPLFSCIVINPPFVRFEDWMKQEPAYEDIRRFVIESTGEAIDSRADYFVPIILHLWRLLKEGGRLGAIFPNSWLGAGWGISFRRVLLKFFCIESVITSGSGRWFQNADVVANIVILKRRERIGQADVAECISFAVTKCPLSAWSEERVSAMSDALIRAHNAYSEVVRISRVRVASLIRYEASGLSWTAFFADCQWLDALAESMISVSTFFAINRGERRGWDALFYPPEDCGIETEYLLPVLKSFSDIKRLHACADGLAFCCSRSLDELRQRKHSGTLRWILKFEGANNGSGIPLPAVLAKPGALWYEMRPDSTADLAVSMNPDKRLFFARLEPRAFVNQRLIRLTARAENVDVPLCHALLCSVVGCYYLEALGFGRGLGVLDLTARKLSTQMKMLDPSLISSGARARILDAFNRLNERNVLNLSDELNQQDRITFEMAVLESYGFAHLFPRIRAAVLELHRIRAVAREPA